MGNKTTSELLEKIWSQTSFGRLLNDLAACEDYTWEDLAEKTGIDLSRVRAIADGALGSPSIAEAEAIARALGYSIFPFLEKALDKHLSEAGMDYTCKLTHKAPWES